MNQEEHDQRQNPTLDPLTIGELISLAEAAQQSGFSHDYLRDIAVSGRLKAKKIGRNWVTTISAVEEYKHNRSHILKSED